LKSKATTNSYKKVKMILDILKDLLKTRPVFHSEDDFKFALSQKISEKHQDYELRLERPFDIEMLDKIEKRDKNGNIIKDIVRAPIDIVIIDKDGTYIPIELKYKTKDTKIELTGIEGDDVYDLAKHGASDIGRVSFRKDIYRIERFLEFYSEKCKEGFVIILTNENEYWDNILEKEILNRRYSFHHDYKIPMADPGWYYEALSKNKYINIDGVWVYKDNQKKKHWTFNGDLKYQLTLKKEYKINWQEYSKIDSVFKFCLIEVS
jgi:L-fucose mutarotase/ribose pyranase (RbsD/FucU family)